MFQYADDTIVLIKEDVEQVRNVKLLLYLFEQMSGLKINFQKSEILLVQHDEEKLLFYSEMFCCKTGTWPLKYLGVPISGSKLLVSDWAALVEKVQKRLDGWKGSVLSIGGRHTLINSCLTSTPIYHMSMYLLPLTVVEQLDKPRRKIFWQGGQQKKKYHMVRWKLICRPKQKGGLGITNLRWLNTSLLCKWWWKLEHDSGIWQQVVFGKYGEHLCVRHVLPKVSDSPF